MSAAVMPSSAVVRFCISVLITVLAAWSRFSLAPIWPRVEAMLLIAALMLVSSD